MDRVSGTITLETVKVIAVITGRCEQGSLLDSFANPHPVTSKPKRQKWWQVNNTGSIRLGN